MGFGSLGGILNELGNGSELNTGRLTGLLGSGGKAAQQSAASTQSSGDPVTQLMCDAMFGNISGVKSAVLNGTEINTKDKFGRTALIYASIGAASEVISFLLQNKADPSLMDNYGKTAKEYASFVIPNLARLFPA